MNIQRPIGSSALLWIVICASRILAADTPTTPAVDSLIGDDAKPADSK